MSDTDIGRPATLLLGSKRRALAEFEECTFKNKPRMKWLAPEQIDRKWTRTDRQQRS